LYPLPKKGKRRGFSRGGEEFLKNIIHEGMWIIKANDQDGLGHAFGR
jgi:hypothetical protein